MSERVAVAGARGGAEAAEIGHPRAEYLLHPANAVADAAKNAVAHVDETPEQLDGARRIGFGETRGDGGSQVVELLRQGLALVPFDEGARAGDSLQALVDFAGEAAGALSRRQHHAELLAQGRVRRRMGDQSLGKRLGPERCQGVDRYFHSARHLISVRDDLL
jgi:hypothetical protein